MEVAKYIVRKNGEVGCAVVPYVTQFATTAQMCQHLLDIATDCSPSAQAKLRLMTSILRTNRALWSR